MKKALSSRSASGSALAFMNHTLGKLALNCALGSLVIAMPRSRERGEGGRIEFVYHCLHIALM